MERPIIFSTEMVRAILEGRKIQTRRIVKCNLEIASLATPEQWNQGRAHPQMVKYETWGLKRGCALFESDTGTIFALKCPHGKPGDLLWVRETWRPSQIENKVWYRAGQWDCLGERLISPHESHLGLDGDNKWKSPYHMFKKYARIWLEILNVRVERLQDITGPDAVSEGIDLSNIHDSYHHQNQIGVFKKLWNQINGKKHPWSSNCWVWVIEFKRIEK